MNKFSSTINSTGLLKNAYKGPIAKMGDNMPMMFALRKKRDQLKTK